MTEKRSALILPPMATLARYGIGRIVLHLLAMCGDGNIRFHVAGIRRELPEIGLL